MRSFWVGSGWKMNHLRKDAEDYVGRLTNYLASTNLDFNVFIMPPFTVLADVCKSAKSSKLIIGAQNMSWEDKGAFTGEISPLMVKDCGATIVELGHSERRTFFGETDIYINEKVLSSLRHGLRPLICIGETREENKLGISREVLARQIKIALHGVAPEFIYQVLFAYEPAWAIGDRGTPADPSYASTIHKWVREQIAEMYSPEQADMVPILYGGSVNQKNAISFVSESDIDGLFIGRAGWNSQSFIRILDLVQSLRKEKAQKVGVSKIQPGNSHLLPHQKSEDLF